MDSAVIDREWRERVRGKLVSLYGRMALYLFDDAWQETLLRVWRFNVPVDERTGYPLFRVCKQRMFRLANGWLYRGSDGKAHLGARDELSRVDEGCVALRTRDDRWQMVTEAFDRCRSRAVRRWLEAWITRADSFTEDPPEPSELAVEIGMSVPNWQYGQKLGRRYLAECCRQAGIRFEGGTITGKAKALEKEIDDRRMTRYRKASAAA